MHTGTLAFIETRMYTCVSIYTDICHACGFLSSYSDLLCDLLCRRSGDFPPVALSKPVVCKEGIQKQFGVCLTGTNICPVHVVPRACLRRLCYGKCRNLDRIMERKRQEA